VSSTTDTVITALAVLGVIAQALLGALLVIGVLRLVGISSPWRFIREALSGSELWFAFAVALVATGGSLYFSEVAHFIPCKLCWFQRVAMYPLVLLALPALRNDRRAAQYFLPLPLVGLGVSVWHILVELSVISETTSCSISAPGGCATKWIDEFGYMTIPTLAATAFALIAFLLALAAFGTEAATEPARQAESGTEARVTVARRRPRRSGHPRIARTTGTRPSD
jgi:disulfide bond formation protein DsbB